jgi:broad specificity phosphatase PhoE
VRIVFETHSLTTDNERGVATGWLDGTLSARGRADARRLGERRRSADMAAVFTSDLGRAVETGEIAFGCVDVAIHRDARLRECNYGRLNGMPVNQLEASRTEHINVPYPGGESYRDVVERVATFLGDLSSDRQGTSVLLIGHAATRWSLDNLVDGRPLEDLVGAPFDWQEGWRYTLR